MPRSKWWAMFREISEIHSYFLFSWQCYATWLFFSLASTWTNTITTCSSITCVLPSSKGGSASNPSMGVSTMRRIRGKLSRVHCKWLNSLRLIIIKVDGITGKAWFVRFSVFAYFSMSIFEFSTPVYKSKLRKAFCLVLTSYIPADTVSMFL